jgi:hypothetical protein
MKNPGVESSCSPPPGHAVSDYDKVFWKQAR